MHERRRIISAAAGEKLYIIKKGAVSGKIEYANSKGKTDEQSGRYVPSSVGETDMSVFGVNVSGYKRLVVDWGAQNNNWEYAASTQVLWCGFGNDKGSQTYLEDVTRDLSKGERGFDSEVRYIDISGYEGTNYVKIHIRNEQNEYYSFINNLYLTK